MVYRSGLISIAGATADLVQRFHAVFVHPCSHLVGNGLHGAGVRKVCSAHLHCGGTGHDELQCVTARGDAAQTLLDDALALEAAGAQLLVLECVPVELAKRITDALSIPVIGIGAGNVTDGQILVMHDAFGITGGHIPKFAKNFLAEAGDMRAAVRQYIADVESGVYPGEEHSFH